jgi:outer membrane protein W
MTTKTVPMALLAVIFIFSNASVVAAPALAGTSQSEAPGSEEMTLQDRPGPIGRAFDYVAHNIYFRAGVLYFDYFGSSTDLTGSGPAAALLPDNPIPDAGSSISSKLTLGMTYGLFIPQTAHHLAVELALAPPLDLQFRAAGTARGIGENDVFSPFTGNQALGRHIGNFKALPPSFTLVYRPWTQTKFQPYIGAGAMYLYTYDKDVSNTRLKQISKGLGRAGLGGNGHPTLYLSKPVACVGQLGFDFTLSEHAYVNADARYVGCTSVKAVLNLGDGDSIASNNHFNAMLYQLSFGFRF